MLSWSKKRKELQSLKECIPLDPSSVDFIAGQHFLLAKLCSPQFEGFKLSFLSWRLHPERLAKALTLGYSALMAATESGVKVEAQYGKNVPFAGFADGSASMAKLRTKWKSIPCSIGT
nr:hypothetical protein Iba_chr02dCG4310 [Ipomoea batatas]GMC66636.1 hypothetical protein Iba_chr02eCG7560 [Ipomoea batatas]